VWRGTGGGVPFLVLDGKGGLDGAISWSLECWLLHECAGGSTLVVVSIWIGVGWIGRAAVRDRGLGIGPEYCSFMTVATLARLSLPSSILPKSPPKSKSKSPSTLGGVTVVVVEVDEVGALGRP